VEHPQRPPATSPLDLHPSISSGKHPISFFPVHGTRPRPSKGTAQERLGPFLHVDLLLGTIADEVKLVVLSDIIQSVVGKLVRYLTLARKHAQIRFGDVADG